MRACFSDKINRLVDCPLTKPILTKPNTLVNADADSLKRVSARKKPVPGRVKKGIKMKIIEAALYKLALKGHITLEEAKILKAIYSNRACRLPTIASETGLGEHQVLAHASNLSAAGIISEKGGIYFCENFPEKISELIRKDSLQKGQTLLVQIPLSHNLI